MLLTDLIAEISTKKILGSVDVDIKNICADSRKVTDGDLFVAVNGVAVDGHKYIDTAIENGAKVIVCQNLPSATEEGITYVQVEDSADCLGRLASAYYDYPSEKLIIIGVTGTNGKTTIATLLYELYKELGYKVGLLSTVCNYINGRPIPSTHTTPDALSLQKLLAEMAEERCYYVFMEVSSHSVDQKRIAGINFDGAIFTNITRDHLDYHKTFSNYIKAKQDFFTGLPIHAFALTNVDDKNGKIITQNTSANVYSYSLETYANFKGKVLEESMDGMLLKVDNSELYVRLIGHFNAYNMLAVYGVTKILRTPTEDVLVALSNLKPVNGRFECYRLKNGASAVIDYAHTPDALENVLNTVKQINKTGKTICVVGCGGNRDKGKRPMMAKIAVKMSDEVFFTSDNPRDEEVKDIINDMLAGLTEDEKMNVTCIEDRKQAILEACNVAEKGDVILIAGKGHETYQEIKGVKYHFDDKEIILN